MEFIKPRRVIRTAHEAMKEDALTEMTQVDKKTEPLNWLVIHIHQSERSSLFSMA